MKKTYAILMVVMYLVAMVPMAFAASFVKYDGIDGESKDSASEDNDTDNKRPHRRGMQPNAERGDPDRPIITGRERLEKARANFKDAQDRFRAAKAEHEDRREAWKELTDEVRAICDEDPESEDCQTAQHDAIEEAKRFLINAANKIISHVEQIIAKVEANDNLSDEEKEEILEELNTVIDELEAIIVLCEEAETREDIKEVREELGRYWRGIHHHIRVHAAKVAYAKLNHVVQRFDLAEDNMECTIESLGDDVDKTELKQLHKEFDSKVDSAEDHLADAKENWLAIKEILNEDDELDEEEKEEIRRLWKSAKEHLHGAQRDLHEAHKVLKEFIKELRSLGGSMVSCTDDDDQDDADDDVDDEDDAEEEEESDDEEDSDDDSGDSEDEDDEDDSTV